MMRGSCRSIVPSDVDHGPRDHDLVYRQYDVHAGTLKNDGCPTHRTSQAHLDEEQRLLETGEGAQVNSRETTDCHRTDAVEEAVYV